VAAAQRQPQDDGRCPVRLCPPRGADSCRTATGLRPEAAAAVSAGAPSEDTTSAIELAATMALAKHPRSVL
jgi:hypothetical protein